MFTYQRLTRNGWRKLRQRQALSVFLLLLLAGTAFSIWLARGTGGEEENGNVMEQEVMADHERSAVLAQQARAVEITPATSDPVKPPPPPPPDMNIMKTKGCVADGLLTNYGDDKKRLAKMINDSECLYLHRAVETWLEAPNFEHVKEFKDRITKPGIVYGMFIAEAIATNDDYYSTEEDREFDFDKMCRKGTENDWGEHTCKPSFERKEYRKYLRQITQQAMDLGIQSFMFGQVYYQEPDIKDPVMPEIIREMRQYADSLGMQIVIGAQTNDITDEKYLRLFDYIEGGVGIDSNGQVESGPCFSRWYQQPGDWCWGLLWHPQFASKANNVFVHLDWSGRKGDDMATFALMDRETREQTLSDLYRKFTSQNVGFMMPFLAVLPKDNGGCYGPEKGFYAPDNKYKCKDEDAINTILRKGKK